MPVSLPPMITPHPVLIRLAMNQRVSFWDPRVLRTVRDPNHLPAVLAAIRLGHPQARALARWAGLYRAAPYLAPVLAQAGHLDLAFAALSSLPDRELTGTPVGAVALRTALYRLRLFQDTHPAAQGLSPAARAYADHLESGAPLHVRWRGWARRLAQFCFASPHYRETDPPFGHDSRMAGLLAVQGRWALLRRFRDNGWMDLGVWSEVAVDTSLPDAVLAAVPDEVSLIDFTTRAQARCGLEDSPPWWDILSQTPTIKRLNGEIQRLAFRVAFRRLYNLDLQQQMRRGAALAATPVYQLPSLPAFVPLMDRLLRYLERDEIKASEFHDSFARWDWTHLPAPASRYLRRKTSVRATLNGEVSSLKNPTMALYLKAYYLKAYYLLSNYPTAASLPVESLALVVSLCRNQVAPATCLADSVTALIGPTPQDVSTLVDRLEHWRLAAAAVLVLGQDEARACVSALPALPADNPLLRDVDLQPLAAVLTYSRLARAAQAVSAPNPQEAPAVRESVPDSRPPRRM